MNLIGGFVTIIFFLVVPLCLGLLFNGNRVYKIEKALYMYIMGFLMEIAMFQVISVPMNVLHFRFSVIYVVYLFALLMTCLGSVIYSTMKRGSVIVTWLNVLKYQLKWHPFILFAVILLMVQIYFSVFLANYHYEDDMAYIFDALATLDTDYPFVAGYYDASTFIPDLKRLLCDWNIFYAVIAKTSGVHPAVIEHTIAPFFLLVMFFLCNGLMSLVIMNGNRKHAAEFMTVYTLLLMFGFHNHAFIDASYYMFDFPWTGRSMLVGVGFPLGIYIWNRWQKADYSWHMSKEVFVLVFACCNFTFMGVITLPFFFGVLWLSHAIYYRRCNGVLQFFAVVFPEIIYIVMYMVADNIYGSFL